MENWP